MPILVCEDVSFAYDGAVVARDINFHVNDGDYLCIVGENGSGKTTLIKGLLKLKAPRSGTIRHAVKPVEMGYLPQQSIVQRDFPASVYEVVISGRLGARGLWPFYTKADKALVSENLRRLDIYGLRNRCYRELSGGQQQRVLLARALTAASKIMLLDEPTAGLDPVATKDLYEIISRLNRESGITVVMISHDVASAVKYAGLILHLQNKQIFFGSAKNYAASAIGENFLKGRTA
jgi:zinc transport system ATP-binding protein